MAIDRFNADDYDSIVQANLTPNQPEILASEVFAEIEKRCGSGQQYCTFPNIISDDEKAKLEAAGYIVTRNTIDSENIDGADSRYIGFQVALNATAAEKSMVIGQTGENGIEGGSAILITKSITVNGTYNASDDNADGYSSVSVNVSGSSESVNDVNFYDYDGTIVKSYSASDFANLSTLPENPSHIGLTAQGWNWTLADAKTYVANYGRLNIGQMYKSNTPNGDTLLHIRLGDGRLKPYLGLTGNSNGTAVDIDWGDGSAVESVTLDTDTVYTPHEYATEGEYTIAISVTSGTIRFNGNNSVYSNIFRKSATPNTNDDKVYQNILVKAEIGTSVTDIGNFAFSYCSSLTSITIPDGVITTGSAAFLYCYSLTSITIPDSFTSIGPYAFQYCPSLSSITIPDGCAIMGYNAFGGCSSLSSIAIPDTVTGIDAYTFNGCSALTSITIPDTVTSIGNNAFNGCSSLSSIAIPDTVTSIGSGAFRVCSALTSITIPDTVTSIGNNAFNGCSGLAFIKFTRTTPPTVSASNAFTDIPTDCIIYVPALVSNLYMNGTNYPNKSTYKYIGYATYESGAALPTTTTDETHILTWYATSADAIAETNPIIQGNGNEVYARATAIVTVSRYVDFTTDTTTIIGNPDTYSVYMNINRCNVADDGTINAYYGDAGYTEDGSNGQVMVKIPKFYYKVTPDENGGLDGVNIRKCKWEISDSADNGFTLHPAFYDASGNEIDYFLYGAFDAVGQDSNGNYSTSYHTTTYKLGSVGGNTYAPTNLLTRATARTMATNRGTGWYNAGVKQTMALQMLFAVEYGFNSQKTLGWGIVGASAASNTGTTTGSISSGDLVGKTTAVNWRGIENFWGNVFNWIDGLNFSNRTPYICDTYTFVDDTSTGYTQIAFALPSSNWISALGYDANNDWIILPSEAIDATADSTIGDYVSSSSSWRVALLGGRWDSGSSAGAFCWNCYNNSSYLHSNIGARIMYLPQSA